MYENLHIHERLNNSLSILNSMQLTGFAQWNPVVTVMRELASLDQEIVQAEKKAAEAEEEDAPCEACKVHLEKEE